MAGYRITDPTAIINKQIKFQRVLFEHLSKAEALIKIVLSDEFKNCKYSIIETLLCTVCKILEEAKTLSEQILNMCKIYQSTRKQ